MEKVYIQPHELRMYWTFVRKGLQTILSKSPEDWIPEDVYVDCFNSKALLWAFKQDNRLVGFSVLQPQGDNLHIWCAYFEHNLEPCWQAIQEIAVVGGARTITFDSHRKGWDQVARKLGFSPRKWIKEL
jgi:hypothetical protein